jgi:Tfp pilus assembly protein PilF
METLLMLTLLAQSAEPAYATLERAYQALRAADYEAAIGALQEAVAIAPERPSIRKDLAYTLLKTGENVAAREQFAEAMRLDPADELAALEYAFLCYETKQPAEARRVFDRLRRLGNATAQQAFENVDGPLREGIARWQAVVEQSPDNFSAHEELARLAEQRDELDLAARHYQAAWRLRPTRRDLLLALGRVWKQKGEIELSNAALLAASRGAEPRVAEQARALLPERYPYVYEFENALRLDPANYELRRELAYLHLEMGNHEAAQRELERLPPAAAPGGDDPALAVRRESMPPAKVMAERSLEKGYLIDALRYLHAAHENDPADFDVMLKLGITYNNLREDREAVRWFDRARQAPDGRIAAEAERAYRNLAPAARRWGVAVWAFPMISTRWRNTFAYAQTKAEWRAFRALPLRPYASLRFIGDMRGRADPVAGIGPQYLSERSAIVGLGLASAAWKGLSAWFEAGEALRYQEGPGARATPDFRGGLSYARSLAWGRGWFAETSSDLVFLSRFNRDTLLYSLNRTGWSLNDSAQVYWNWNLNTDVKREYWANTVETGPGVRYRVEAVTFSANILRGVYLTNTGNPFRPNYLDVRIGVWYAFSR